MGKKFVVPTKYGLSGVSREFIDDDDAFTVIKIVDKNGLYASSKEHFGVIGVGNGAGVVGESEHGDGVYGTSENGNGVNGVGHVGVAGESENWRGVFGLSTNHVGVVGESTHGDGVFGVSHNPASAGVSGHNLDSKGLPHPGGLAGFFNGNVVVTSDLQSKSAVIVDLEITGNIQCTGGADCAEDFDIAEVDTIEPGTVMVLGEEGGLRKSFQPYDKCVAGVISGAGDFKPGMVLDKQVSPNKRQPVALLGKAYCKVDADFASVKVGDLLTSSPTPGHAMKATDITQAFGAVIGKALRPLKEGRDLIPILITLQ